MREKSGIPSRRGDSSIHCVVLSSFRSDFSYLQNVFRLAGMRMKHAESLDQADFLLTVTESTALLADFCFEGGNWRDARTLRVYTTMCFA